MVIFTEDDLKHLFANESQREIFIQGINRLISVIQNRTVQVPFVELKEIDKND